MIISFSHSFYIQKQGIVSYTLQNVCSNKQISIFITHVAAVGVSVGGVVGGCGCVCVCVGVGVGVCRELLRSLHLADLKYT